MRGWPFETALDSNNRWVKLSQCIPWDNLAESYYQSLSADRGHPDKEARLVISNASPLKANSVKGKTVTGSTTSEPNGQIFHSPGSTASSW
jgi:hypothetical protein